MLMADPIEIYEIDDWCLSLDSSELPAGAADITIPGSFPTLLIPSPSMTAIGYNENFESEREVSFSKGSSDDLSWRVSRRSHLRSGCEYSLIDEKLSRVVDTGAPNCSVSKDRDYFVSDVIEGPFAAVEIQCSHSELISTCRALDIYETGWRATIWLPKAQFEYWEAAVSDTRIFFHDHIVDCGTQN